MCSSFSSVINYAAAWTAHPKSPCADPESFLSTQNRAAGRAGGDCTDVVCAAAMKSNLPLLCLLVLLPLITATTGCGGGGGAPPPVLVATLSATPEQFAPGAGVALVPRFTGQGRIDPDVGPVQSGVAYSVGPSPVGRSYTLTVERDGEQQTVRLDVPLRYRERARELASAAVARTRHGAVSLSDDQVLLVAGASPSALFWQSSDRFDGRDGRFSPVGEISTGRGECAVAMLPDGSVVALGGATNSSSFEEATRIERWQPATGTWTVVGNMLCNRAGMTATTLVDGRVLIVGGLAVGGAPSDRDAELFDPDGGSRSPDGEMWWPRSGHSATLLADGRVWIAGGADPQTGEPIATTEYFDPATDRFVEGPALLWPRLAHAAVALADGSVLLVGGDDAAGPVAPAERREPVDGALRPAGDLVVPRTLVRAVRLPNGDVVVAGGLLASGLASDSVEVFSPATASWREWPARLPAPRTGHSLHVLGDGRVVVLGGDPGTGYPAPKGFVLD